MKLALVQFGHIGLENLRALEQLIYRHFRIVLQLLLNPAHYFSIGRDHRSTPPCNDEPARTCFASANDKV
ncbi:MAG: hypothetical protein F4X47_10680 [Gammaproteobacteria bacterium]|nr:hypothetical protein [Gammaproteobacteria bacterium]MYC52768.1 hypothetical protein [Gammaproteobacteria bacterium]